jgi:polygalacturonase
MKRTIPLLLLIVALQPCGAQRLFVTDFGAKGDGTTLCTRSLQAAIDSANAIYVANGEKQTVILPPGQYVSGTIYLKSGVTLMIGEGATLLGSTNPFDYVKDPLCRWTALIFAVRQHDIGITGKGTIDGRGWEVANNLVQYIHLGLVNDPLKYDRPNETNRPENIHFRECENVTISRITLRNPASWNQQYDQCHHVVIEDQTVDSKSYWNNDGVDIVDCSDVVIRNCTMDAADDVFCFKSHSVDGVCENVTVENCYGRSSANGIKFGTMTRGKFRHFRFRNIVLRDTYRSAITIASVDGATVEDIEIDGLRATHTGNPLFLRFAERREGKGTPCLKDIVIRNVEVEVPLDKPDAGYSYEGPVEDLPRNVSPSSIVGTPGHRIQNVLLENIVFSYPGHADSAYAYRGCSPEELAAIPEWERRYPEFSMWKELPAWGLYIRHADNITLRNVTLRLNGDDYRPAIVADDVNELTIVGAYPCVRPCEERAYTGVSPYGCQLIANNCGKVKTDSKAIKVKRQKSKGSAKPAVDASQTSSDIILAQDNSTPCSEGATLYKASLFGCKSNGTTLNTTSIQRAIDHIASQGGGTLVFEVGRYLTGSIHLHQGVNIQLNEGAILVASPNIHDYDTADGAPTLIIGSPDGQSRICGLGFVQPTRPDVSLFSSDMKEAF